MSPTQRHPCAVHYLTVAWHSPRIPLKEKSMHSYRWLAGCRRNSWIGTRPWGNLPCSRSRSEVTTVNHRVTPLLSLASFVAILKKPLFMNYQSIGFQLQKTGKDTGKKTGRRGRAQEGRMKEVNEYTRPLFSLLLKWRWEQNLPP